MLEEKLSKLKKIKDFNGLIEYLRDELDWPIEIEDTEDITFDYNPKELGIEGNYAVKINIIKQIRPLVDNQPWGLFYIEFESKSLPVVVLRRILRVLIHSRRSAIIRMKTWDLSDLIFISTLGEEVERKISFAHFTESDKGLPVLRTFSWDPTDTYFHYLQTKLDLEKLSWPNDINDIDSWREKWLSAFKLKHREIIRTSKDLANQMASLAAQIRDQVKYVYKYEIETGPLHKLFENFKKVLIHDLNIENFADMYAQTIAYGLFSARISHVGEFQVEEYSSMIPHTNPFLKKLFDECTKIGEDNLNKIDLEELGIRELILLLKESNMGAILSDFGKQKKGEDPVIHFYELFLEKYAPLQKLKRGVFYTPDFVVSFMVRSVNLFLKQTFGFEEGLADFSKMYILDPACGTGTFLKHIIRITKEMFDEKYDSLNQNELKEKWNEFVNTKLLKKLCGFELMMAPYAVAHLKLGLMLRETGYEFNSTERLRIFLTNTLEATQKGVGGLDPYLDWLTEESDQANSIKNKFPINVIIGNPPYSISSQNMMPWITEKVDEYVERNLLKRESGKPQIKKITGLKSMKDDYIKFIRFAQWILQRNPKKGIISYITNNFYLDGLVARGMRQMLRKHFDEIWIVNLNGDWKRGIPSIIREKGITKDVNPFEDISTGVAISFFLRYGEKEHKERKNDDEYNCIIKYAEKWGELIDSKDEKQNVIQEGKRNFLLNNTINTIQFIDVGKRMDHEFTPIISTNETISEYNSFPGLITIFFQNAVGIVTGQDTLVSNVNKQRLEEILENFYNLKYDKNLLDYSYVARNKIRENGKKYKDEEVTFNDNRDWKINTALKSDKIEAKKSIQKWMYRGFDTRYISYYKPLIKQGTNQFCVMQYLLPHQKNIALVVVRRSGKNKPFTSVFITDKLIDCKNLEGGTGLGNYIFPLKINYSLKRDDVNTPKPAINSNINQSFKKLLNYNVSDEEIFYYIYGILHTPKYRKDYQEFFMKDFPRIPFPTKKYLLLKMANYGKTLTELHLLKSDKINLEDIPYNEERDDEEFRKLKKISYESQDEKIYFNKPTKTRSKKDIFWIGNITEKMWNYEVGGIQQLKQFLNARIYSEKPKKKHLAHALKHDDDELNYFRKIASSIKHILEIVQFSEKETDSISPLDQLYEEIMENIQKFTISQLNNLVEEKKRKFKK